MELTTQWHPCNAICVKQSCSHFRVDRWRGNRAHHCGTADRAAGDASWLQQAEGWIGKQGICGEERPAMVEVLQLAASHLPGQVKLMLCSLLPPPPDTPRLCFELCHTSLPDRAQVPEAHNRPRTRPYYATGAEPWFPSAAHGWYVAPRRGSEPSKRDPTAKIFPSWSSPGLHKYAWPRQARTSNTHTASLEQPTAHA
jgi:hypothetical protein